MSEKKINLEEILNKELNILSIRVEQIEKLALKAMKESCKQVLELAAENVEFIKTTSEELNSKDYVPFITADDNTIWTFDKQSILDTINQIK